MAGGDGSQAIVAAIAAELDLPYACVPAGTRNHFALDLGVDRDDVVGALDAFVAGGERRVDLGEVNGRVFVNNVSLGVYAEAVQRSGYRDAKLRTLLDTVPDTLGPSGSGLDLRWTGPDGQEHSSGAVILVSNNRYRLGRAVGSGTRPAIDDGLLGVTIAGAPTGRGERGRAPQRPVREWSAPTFEVRADQPVPAGIDGEAVRLEPPLRFSIRSLVLRVRIAPQHPGASPSALLPEGFADSVRALARSRRASGAPSTNRRPDGHVEIEQKEKVSRKEVATRLQKAGDPFSQRQRRQLQAERDVDDGPRPDEVELKVELKKTASASSRSSSSGDMATKRHGAAIKPRPVPERARGGRQGGA